MAEKNISFKISLLAALLLIAPHSAMSVSGTDPNDPNLTTGAPPLLAGTQYCASPAIATAYIDSYPACYVPCAAASCPQDSKDNKQGAVFSQAGSDTNVVAANTQATGVGTQTDSVGYQCFELAARYFKFQQKVTLPVPPSKAAKDLCTAQSTQDFTVYPASANYTPVHGDLMVYDAVPATAGNPAGMPDGHVAVVNNVPEGTGTVSLIEQNWPSATSGIRTDSTQKALCWIHATKNKGYCPARSYSGPATTDPNAVSTCDDGIPPPTCTSEPDGNAIFLTGPSIATNASHGLEAFARNENGVLMHKWQNSLLDSSTGLGWFPINDGIWFHVRDGIWMNSDPIAVARSAPQKNGSAAGDLDVFYIGTDYTVCHTYQSGLGWSSPTSIIGNGTVSCGRNSKAPGLVPAGGQVSVLYDPGSRTEQVFYPGKDHSLMTSWQQSYNGPWTAPVALVAGIKDTAPTPTPTPTPKPVTNPGSGTTGGTFPTSAPMPVTRGVFAAQEVGGNIKVIQNNGDTYLLYRGGDLSLQAIFPYPLHSPTASAPLTMTRPGAVNSNIAAATDSRNGGLAIFFRGPDYGVWEIPPTGPKKWDPFTILYGKSSSDITTEYLPGGQIRLIYRAPPPDYGIEYVQQATSAPGGNVTANLWSQHRHLLGTSTSTDCAATATAASDASNSTSLALLKNRLFSNIASTVNADGREEVFFYGSDDALWHAWELTPPTSTAPCTQWNAQKSLDGTFPKCPENMQKGSGNGPPPPATAVAAPAANR